MPDAQKLAEWLDLPCAYCADPATWHFGGAGSCLAGYQPPDPEDGNTMLAVLEALRERRWRVDIMGFADETDWTVMLANRKATTHEAFTSTLPAAVWEAAGVVMEAEVEALAPGSAREGDLLVATVEPMEAESDERR